MQTRKDLLNGFTNGVMKSRPDFADQLAFPVRPCAIGQQDHAHRRIQIDPQ
jgi:hypothetical protein